MSVEQFEPRFPVSYIGCSFRVQRDGEKGASDWEPVNEEVIFGENYDYHADSRQEVLAQIAEEEGGLVQFRSEVWVEDPTCDLKGQGYMWGIENQDSEAALFDTAEDALCFLVETGDQLKSVTRYVLVRADIMEDISVQPSKF